MEMALLVGVSVIVLVFLAYSVYDAKRWQRLRGYDNDRVPWLVHVFFVLGGSCCADCMPVFGLGAAKKQE